MPPLLDQHLPHHLAPPLPLLGLNYTSPMFTSSTIYPLTRHTPRKRSIDGTERAKWWMALRHAAQAWRESRGHCLGESKTTPGILVASPRPSQGAIGSARLRRGARILKPSPPPFPSPSLQTSTPLSCLPSTDRWHDRAVPSGRGIKPRFDSRSLRAQSKVPRGSICLWRCTEGLSSHSSFVIRECWMVNAVVVEATLGGDDPHSGDAAAIDCRSSRMLPGDPRGTTVSLVWVGVKLAGRVKAVKVPLFHVPLSVMHT
ncbi:hypothetical protein FA13DRAFT_1713727 [Coprinellus micaceus]|uniref:Uncharacterized protein n=1 Tax=Coprinellus micaceus TaxID=71717 RepID=A0A4Y7SVN6_COPMI|nr:hypothetical protein FA13DRAFT_1713727 [Coprinellus micaceus]